MRALLYKELREVGPWGLGAAVVLCAWAQHHAQWVCAREAASHLPYLDKLWPATLALAVWLWPLAVALRQTASEGLANTWPWLKVRGRSQPLVVATKVAVGLLAAGLPVLAATIVLVAGFAREGALQRPFDLAEVGGAVRACFAAPAVYLGALLALLPPERAWSDRLPACLGALVLGGLLTVLRLTPQVALAASAACCGVLLWAVLAAGSDRRVG